MLLPLIPPDCGWLKPLYDPAWERVYAAIEDHDLVINQHSGQGSPYYGEGPVPEALWISEVTFYCQAGFRHLLMSGVYERHPKLKYILTESGCGWVGPMLKQLDGIHMGFKAGAIGEMSYKGMEWVLKDKPSEYAARNCFYGASFPSKADLAGIDAIGEDRVLWGNDYPHYEGTFPYTLESLRLTFADMSETRRRKLLGENAAKLYKFDLEKLRPLAEQYGPRPSQISTPLTRDEIPRDSTCQLFQSALYGILTMGMPKHIGIVDTMIGFPADDFKMYDFIRAQLKDPSATFEFPVEYMFKNVPKELYGKGDPISITLHEMDRFGIEIGLIGVGGDVSRKALKEHPDRFVPIGNVDPNKGMEGIRQMVRDYEANSACVLSARSMPASIRRSASRMQGCIRSTRSAWSSACRSSRARVCLVRVFRCGRRRCG